VKSPGFIPFALLLATLTGCPGEEEQPPTADETGGSTGGPTTTAPTTTPSTSESETEPTTTTTPTTTDTEGETESDTDNPDCEAEGCWSCALEQPEHFLNACTDASCEPFDNAKRLPLLNDDGTLPPLP
jgi:hypothetical protein